MDSVEYRTVDKSKWGYGPWQDEPDKAQYSDAASGLPCLVVRGPHGGLCGYVGVTGGHPCYGKSCEETDNLNVHGGITFGGLCQASEDESKHICHKPAPGEPDNIWWLGFDCAHSGDFLPKYFADACERGSGHLFERADWETYKALPYVKHQIQMLAQQLHALTP